MKAYYNNKTDKLIKKAEHWYQFDTYETVDSWVKVKVLGVQTDREYEGEGVWGDYYSEYLIQLPNGKIIKTNDVFLTKKG